MPNIHIHTRLTGIHQALKAAYTQSVGMSAASKGREREWFIDSFLSHVLPNHYRFGNGDATDLAGARSGQLDVVVELPFAPSLPSVGGGPTRLYPAESIAAAMEVKSDLAAQWSEVQKTAATLFPLRRNYINTLAIAGVVLPNVPFIAVGYTGWKTWQTLQSKVESEPGILAALVVDPPAFVWRSSWNGGGHADGDYALWAMICLVHQVTTGLALATTEPFKYLYP